MEPEELDIPALVEEPFNVPDLAELWPEILQCHRNMGFQIPLTDKEKGGVLTDNEMIREFQWIYGQYRKYIGTKKNQFLSLRGNLREMLDAIKASLEKESETPTDRTTLVYQAMRNDWLNNTWNHIAWIVEQIEARIEEDENGA